jgi:Flp pilus assembly protein TadD
VIFRLTLAFTLACSGSASRSPVAPTPTAVVSEADRQAALDAMKLVDEGRANQAVPIFRGLLGKYPNHPELTYELAAAYLADHQPQSAIDSLTSVQKAGFGANHFSLLGSALDDLGRSKEAQEVFNSGIAKFPMSGRLYTNAGINAVKGDRLDEAATYFERGIVAEPSWASNYMRAAQLFASSDEKLWALIYGEVFLNLERGSERTERASKMLFDVWTSAVSAKKDAKGKIAVSVALSKRANQASAGKLPFEAYYELSSMPGFATLDNGNDKVDLGLIFKVRKAFLTSWFSVELPTDKEFPLFQYQRQVDAAGHFEAYSYWLFGRGNPDEMRAWLAANRAGFDGFLAWFESHPIALNSHIARTSVND